MGIRSHLENNIIGMFILSLSIHLFIILHIITITQEVKGIQNSMDDKKVEQTSHHLKNKWKVLEKPKKKKILKKMMGRNFRKNVRHKFKQTLMRTSHNKEVKRKSKFRKGKTNKFNRLTKNKKDFQTI